MIEGSKRDGKILPIVCPRSRTRRNSLNSRMSLSTRLRKKLEPLQLALEGHFTEHHRLQLKFLLDFVEFGEKQLSNLDSEVQLLLTPVPSEPSVPNADDVSLPKRRTLHRKARAADKPLSSSGTASPVSINWQPRLSLLKLGPTWISFPVPVTCPPGLDFVLAIMRARGSAAQGKLEKAASGCGELSVKPHGLPHAQRTLIWRHNIDG